jgi:hypothetical protein
VSEAEKAGERSAAAEARAQAAAAETTRLRDDAAQELERVRTDAARERDEMRAALEARAGVLEESRGELRARAERAERELDRVRQAEASTGDEAPTPPARRRRTARDDS